MVIYRGEDMNNISVLSILLVGSVFAVDQSRGVDTSQSPTSEHTITKDLTGQLLLNYTRDNLREFYRMIFSDLSSSRNERTETLQFPKSMLHRVIFNNDGYDEGVQLIPPELNAGLFPRS